MSTITPILNQLPAGGEGTNELLPLIYAELRRLASFRLKNAPNGQTLQITSLVHEAYLRIARGEKKQWENRGHFFAAAAEVMRHIVIENIRRRKSLKRGGNFIRFSIEDYDVVVDSPNLDELLDLDQALNKLSESDPELARLVELRYFAGLTIDETAQALQMSPRTVKRNWAFVRAWLGRELGSNANKLD
ncbi:sigma-70 family RNA polymerase sigma factor [Bremerella sp. JC770]|uniref:sigma-70 family RNA polymerase sigma factor n=1 Tax=Bremerella sp. JC770 TaxID=3232137 RepID=UPI0034586A7D